MLEVADWKVMLLRLSVATIIGFGLGLEREIRGHDAGMRTHALVSLSSAMITISSLLLFAALQQKGGNGDPLRVVQGLAQAIGFIAGGLIFIRGGGVHNMTTAASLWMAAAVGIGAGAGQFELVTMGAVMAAVLLLLDSVFHVVLPRKRGGKESGDMMPNRRGSTRLTESPDTKRSPAAGR